MVDGGFSLSLFLSHSPKIVKELEMRRRREERGRLGREGEKLCFNGRNQKFWLLPSIRIARTKFYRERGTRTQ